MVGKKKRDGARRSFSYFKTCVLIATAIGLACGVKAGSPPGGDSPPTGNGPSNGGPGSSSGGGSRMVKIGVTAGGLGNAQTRALVVRSLLQSSSTGLSVSSPDLTAGQYLGMGVNYGESAVLGFKIRLKGISLNRGIMGHPGADSVSLLNWDSHPRELEIGDGFTGQVTDSSALVLPAGDYTGASVTIERNFDVKAYAYFDSNNDGTIDTTIYTTAAAVVKVNQVLTPTQLTTDATLHFDYYHYNFMYSGPKPNGESFENLLTNFAQPLSICASAPTTGSSGSDAGVASPSNSDADAGSAPDAGTNATDGGSASDAGTASTGSETNNCQNPSQLHIDLLVDTVRVVKAWDGRYGNNADIPQVGSPFPYADHTTNGMTYGFTQGRPDFGIVYLPIFAFVTANDSGVGTTGFQTYLVSEYAPSDPAFQSLDSYRVTVVFDAQGVPQIGQSQANRAGLSLYLGQAARLFQSTDSSTQTYQFYTSGASQDPTTHVDDGGLYYNNVSTMAAHRFTGFRKVANIGDVLEVHQYDGLRCDSRFEEKVMHEAMGNPLTNYDAYDYCGAFNYDNAVSGGNSSLAAQYSHDSVGDLYRKVYFVRVK